LTHAPSARLRTVPGSMWDAGHTQRRGTPAAHRRAASGRTAPAGAHELHAAQVLPEGLPGRFDPISTRVV